MITQGSLPHLVQGRAIALQVDGEDTDTDHVAEVAACGPQDCPQVGEELLGFRLSGVRELPCRRIDPEESGHENPPVHLDCLWNRARMHRSFGGFDCSHI
jgi:hypothetical protein